MEGSHMHTHIVRLHMHGYILYVEWNYILDAVTGTDIT